MPIIRVERVRFIMQSLNEEDIENVYQFFVFDKLLKYKHLQNQHFFKIGR